MRPLHPRTGALLALVGLVADPARAALTNGGFETGTLAGWYSSGATAMVNASTAFPPLAGNWSALVVAMSSAPVPPYTCDVELWNYSCPLPVPFAASGAAAPIHANFNGVDVGNAFVRGSYVGVDVAVQAGQTLSWNWRPYGEAAGPFLPPVFPIDRARFYATDGTVERWFDYDGVRNSFQFTTSGTWSVYFGVYQTKDPTIWSAVAIDAVTLSAVPEPAPWLLGTGGALFAALAARRRAAPARRGTN